MSERDKPMPVRLQDWLNRALRRTRSGTRWYNQRLSRIYSPSAAALLGTALVGLMAAVLLFLPPFVGVADDGSLGQIMLGAGLSYRTQDLAAPAGAYAVRLYLHALPIPQGFSTHTLFLRCAMGLDDLLTPDQLFDVRFLALLYLLCYLPAVFLVLRGLAARVKLASEATVLTVLGAMVLGDGVVLAHFNSLYPDPLWQIALTYCMGFCMALQYADERWDTAGFLGVGAAGTVLALSEAHCAMPAAVLAVFCLRQLMMEQKGRRTTLLAVLGTTALLTAAALSIGLSTSRFTDSSKLHAMTNGVLRRSVNPAETLAEFDIDPRFELLTDDSSYEDYPTALAGQAELQRDFLSRYSTLSLMSYYIRHPIAFSWLLEVGVQASFSSLRSYVGSYEASLGLPERARNPLFLLYSNFKSNTLPQTTGFLLLLSIVYVVLFRQKRDALHHRRQWTPRERQVMLDTFFCALGMGLADIAAVLVLSGTAELERYQMLCGACVDQMTLLFAAEVLHRLNLFRGEELTDG